MKIELHDMSEVYAFADLVNDAKAWRNRENPEWLAKLGRVPTRTVERLELEVVADTTQLRQAVREAVSDAEIEASRINDHDQPETESGPSLPEEAAQAPELDADGRRWDERIDSSNKGLNKDGTWRARRNHGLSDEEVAAIKNEGRLEADTKTQDEAKDIEVSAVTETHPLPVDTEEALETRDYSDLIFKASELAGDQKDGLLDVLNAAKEFVKAHSPMAWTEFSQAVVPGKSVQGYEPAERRLILAAIKVYNAENAS